MAQAIRDFRGSNIREPTLPANGNIEEYRGWLLKNVLLYISDSSVSEEDAIKELSIWYIRFCVLFPGAKVPKNPFAKSSAHKYKRLLELFKQRLRPATEQNLVPSFTAQEESLFDELFHDATEALDRESLEESRRLGKLSTTSRKRSRRSTYETSPSTPAPRIITAEMMTDTSTLTAPSPNVLNPNIMGPPRDRSPSLRNAPGLVPQPPEPHLLLPPGMAVPIPTFGDQVSSDCDWDSLSNSGDMLAGNQDFDFIHWPPEGQPEQSNGFPGC
ncbi:hypothetical protein E8E11_006591 [Didymella keratinophila]|nr:hypothetical protein E8E11_006591 [Didymella keratinophila]